VKVAIYWNGGTAEGDAKLYRVTGDPGALTHNAVTIPVGLTITRRRPCFLEYWENYVIISNFWTQPIMVYYDGSTTKSWITGLTAPTGAGVTVATNGAGALTATVNSAYITYAHETPSGFKLAESNPSPQLIAVNINAVANKIRFAGLPVASPDGRVNKIYGYLGLEGFLERKVFTMSFGSATADVDLSAAAIAELAAIINDGIEVRPQARTAPPLIRYIHIYNKRVIYAMQGGSPSYPYRFLYSEIDEPESVDPSNIFDDEMKETITGLGPYDGNLIVFCRRAMSGLRGWTSGRDGNPADMSFKRIDNSIGALFHHGILSINRRLYHWAYDGLRMFAGQTRLLGIKALATEAFEAAPMEFYNAIALNDTRENCYVLLLGQRSASTLKYVYYYQVADPNIGGSDAEPPWGFDVRGRLDTTTFAWRKTDGTIVQGSGSMDGVSRTENIDSNVDDDGDVLAKRWTVIGKHDFCNIPGGALDNEGKRFNRLWLYMNAQTGTVYLKLWAGDERSYPGSYAPSREDSLVDPATLRVETDFTYTPMPKSVWEFKPEVSGRGLTVGFTIYAPPVGSLYYGYTIWSVPGSSGRLASERVAT
jgi:hypothetical protein